MTIRRTQPQDLPALQVVLDETELFPSDMLAPMIDGFLNAPESNEIWLTCEEDNQAIGFCYAVPEQLADGAWNMLAIAVLPRKQDQDYGAALTQQLEATLKASGQRILIADTSSTDAFTQTRAFYAKNGYTQEARIRDFWDTGDDKIVFWKSLNASD